MKIIISGEQNEGKTRLAITLTRLLHREGYWKTQLFGSDKKITGMLNQRVSENEELQKDALIIIEDNK